MFIWVAAGVACVVFLLPALLYMEVSGRIRNGHWGDSAHRERKCDCFTDADRRALRVARLGENYVRQSEAAAEARARRDALLASPTPSWNAEVVPVQDPAPVFGNSVPRPVPTPAAAPFGYRRQGSQLVPDPAEQAVIERIRTLDVQGVPRLHEVVEAERLTGRYGPFTLSMIIDIVQSGHCVEAPYGQRRTIEGSLEDDPLEQEVITLLREVGETGGGRVDAIIGDLLHEGYLYRGGTRWPVSVIFEHVL
jgi:hypothetical protein